MSFEMLVPETWEQPQDREGWLMLADYWEDAGKGYEGKREKCKYISELGMLDVLQWSNSSKISGICRRCLKDQGLRYKGSSFIWDVKIGCAKCGTIFGSS